VEEDNVIVEIASKVESNEDELDAAGTEEVVVPQTKYPVQVVVFETQPEADVNNQPRDVVAGHKYGGFIQPAESECDNYSSYSQLASQQSEKSYTCYHCGNGMATVWCPTCTYEVEFRCAEYNEEWLGNEDDCPVDARGFHNWNRKIVETEGLPALKNARHL
jgi:hypothetical protein